MGLETIILSEEIQVQKANVACFLSYVYLHFRYSVFCVSIGVEVETRK